MKKHVLLVLTAVVLVSIISGCTQEPQVKIKELKVAVVDQSQLWSQSKKAKDYQQQLNNKVEELKEKYNTDFKDLSEEKQAAKYQDIYQQINDLREELKEEFREDIAQTVKTIAKEQGYDVVLNKEEVRYGGKDITDEVLEEL